MKIELAIYLIYGCVALLLMFSLTWVVEKQKEKDRKTYESRRRKRAKRYGI